MHQTFGTQWSTRLGELLPEQPASHPCATSATPTSTTASKPSCSNTATTATTTTQRPTTSPPLATNQPTTTTCCGALTTRTTPPCSPSSTPPRTCPGRFSPQPCSHYAPEISPKLATSASHQQLNARQHVKKLMCTPPTQSSNAPPKTYHTYTKLTIAIMPCPHLQLSKHCLLF